MSRQIVQFSSMSAETPLAVGARLRVLVECWDDLRDDGLGLSLCAGPGEIVEVRRISEFGTIIVAHSHREPGAGFCIRAGEYEVMP